MCGTAFRGLYGGARRPSYWGRMKGLSAILPVPLVLCFFACSAGDGVPKMPPAPSSALPPAAIRADSDMRFTVLLGGAGAASPIFSRYSPGGPAQLAANFTRRMDFTGVAWDERQTLTLVSPIHAVMAAHFTRPVGARVVFHDRKGQPHARTITAIERVPGVDVAVARLDSPVPVAFYRMLPPSASYAGPLTGCLVVVTDQKRMAFIHEIGGIHERSVSFRHPSPDRGITLLTKNLISGDSGSPAFLLVGGELVLIETHTTGGPGAGPFYGSPAVFSGVNEAMRKLGGGHQLSLAPVTGG